MDDLQYVRTERLPSGECPTGGRRAQGRTLAHHGWGVALGVEDPGGGAAIDRQDFATAHRLSEEARRLTQGDPVREPEALYWSSVAAYKATHDPNNLVAGWNRLLDQFPQSEWAKKASFIRQ